MNIAKILQQKPIKCDLWSPLVGECYFDRILPNNRINVKFFDCDGHYKEVSFSEDGRYFDSGECLLFPSKEIRDWDKFILETKPFKPYDKVLVRDEDFQAWNANLFSHYSNKCPYLYVCVYKMYKQCIPFDEELVGTTENPK